MEVTWLTLVEILVAVVVLFLSYVFIGYRKTYSFWSSRGIPGPTPLPFFGNYLSYFFRCFRDVDDEYLKKFGKTYGIYEGSKPVLMTSDAELISKIWITNFSSFNKSMELKSPDPLDTNMVSMLSGDDWKRLRNVFASSFSTSRIRFATESVKPSFEKFFQHIDNKVSRNETFDGQELFALLTLDITSRAFYSFNVDTYQEKCDFRDNAKKMFKFPMVELFLMQKLPFWISKKLNLGLRSKESSSYFKKIIVHLVKERMKTVDSESKHRDLLQMFLDAKNDEAVLNGKGMKEIEVMANSAMLLGGSFGTLTTALSFMAWRLSRNPDVQEKLHKEILKVVGSDLSHEINYDDLKAMEFLEATLSETMRMNNMAFRIMRTATEDTVIPGTDIEIPHGTALHVPLYNLHYDSDYFSEPQLFKPERFLPNASEKIVTGSYMPFGLGPRQCVAIRFAQTTLKQVFAELFRRYEIVPNKNGLNELQLPIGTMMASEAATPFKLVPRRK